MPRAGWDELACWLAKNLDADRGAAASLRLRESGSGREKHGRRTDEKVRGMTCRTAVLAEVKDGIGWLTLNRPESLNALSFEMTDLLIKHTAEFEKDAKVRCVVIRGAGTHFMAGGDIKGFHKSLTENKAAHLAGFEMRVVKAHQTIYQIRRMQKPVLASVQGAAAGFGLSLILNCDLAIASDDAFFTLAYRHIGLSADGGATYSCRASWASAKALEIALLGEKFSAAGSQGQQHPQLDRPEGPTRGRDREDGAQARRRSDLRIRLRQAPDPHLVRQFLGRALPSRGRRPCRAARRRIISKG